MYTMLALLLLLSYQEKVNNSASFQEAHYFDWPYFKGNTLMLLFS